jgi:hypothetical protein
MLIVPESVSPSGRCSGTSTFPHGTSSLTRRTSPTDPRSLNKVTLTEIRDPSTGQHSRGSVFLEAHESGLVNRQCVAEPGQLQMMLQIVLRLGALKPEQTRGCRGVAVPP